MNDLEFEYSIANPDAPVAFASFEAMHTIAEIVLVGLSQTQAKSAAESCCSIVAAIQKKLNRHNPESTIARINTSQCGSNTALDAETYTVVELCEVMRKSTLGYFDIAALSHNNINPKFILDRQEHSIELCAEQTTLDFGGFAKGYALEKIKAELIQIGVKCALINFGNSSVAAIGTHPYGESWQVGTDINEQCQFALRDSALSVSGKSPSAKAHIVDPIGGTLSESNEIVAIQGISPLICEILSTALYAAPKQKRASIMANFDGYKATAIDHQGNKVEINR